MTILCIACGEEVNEEQYPTHMQQQHPGGQLASIQKQKMIEQNVPKSAPNLPPGVTPADLPDPVFMETVAMIEQEAQKPAPAQPKKPQEVVEKSPPPPVVEKKITPIELTYKYVGQDEQGHDVATLETDVNDKHFVIAYCLQENKQIESREVANLKPKKGLSSIEWVGRIKEESKSPWVPIETGQPYVCNCGKVYPTPKGLQVHRWRSHKEGEKTI